MALIFVAYNIYFQKRSTFHLLIFVSKQLDNVRSCDCTMKQAASLGSELIREHEGVKKTTKKCSDRDWRRLKL